MHIQLPTCETLFHCINTQWNNFKAFIFVQFEKKTKAFLCKVTRINPIREMVN